MAEDIEKLRAELMRLRGAVQAAKDGERLLDQKQRELERESKGFQDAMQVDAVVSTALRMGPIAGAIILAISMGIRKLFSLRDTKLRNARDGRSEEDRRAQDQRRRIAQEAEKLIPELERRLKSLESKEKRLKDTADRAKREISRRT